jgi:hypothetical protein
MTQPPNPTELETAMAAVYRGPLEEFVSRRDALSKELRAAKRREDSDRVKALRKPSRTAWVLDNIAFEDPASIEHLAAAITGAQTVQSGADLRTALENVRAAVRDVAAAGARLAIRAGQPVDANAIATAVHAVIGDTSAFTDMRAGRLVDVPEGGGLDILTAITIIPPPSPPPPPSSSPSTVPAGPAPPKTEASARAAAEDAELAMAARADLRRAETSLADARDRSDRAEQSVRNAQVELDAAERALLHAEAEVQARRAGVERARQDVEAAAAQVRDAERTVAAARARIPGSSDQ